MLEQQKLEQAITIPVPTEFCFDQAIDYLSRSADECLYHIDNKKIYKLLNVKEKNILMEISSIERGNLLISFVSNEIPSDDVIQSAAVNYVREWFDLDTDLASFYALAKQDQLLEQVVQRFYGLRNIGIPDLFEALCWGIIGQQIQLSFAYKLKRRFVETFGESIQWNNQTHWIFPSPQKVAELAITDLTELQMTKRKAEYLIGIAQLIATGTLSKQSLLGLKDDKLVEKKLVSIRGIGPWTANYVLMRCLQAKTAFPIDDVGLQNAIKHALGSEEKPTKAEIQQLASKWTGWEAYATFYLWRTLY